MSSIQTLNKITDSATPTKEFFSRYFNEPISYPSNQVDAVVGFFKNKGFDEVAAVSVSTILLQQAKVDQVNIFELLDGLKKYNKLQLNGLVAAILNANRSRLSKLGYKEQDNTAYVEKRNILY